MTPEDGKGLAGIRKTYLGAEKDLEAANKAVLVYATSHMDRLRGLFGEACLESGLLVESNPGEVELHSHKNDTGHPDTFDCNAWCVGKGASGGRCEVAPAPPCEQSARCACD